MDQAIGKNRGIGIRFNALINTMLDLFAKIGMYAAPTVEDEAAMYFCLSLDRMDW
jgi:hypothetical protein